jgi:hypothetical protein
MFESTIGKSVNFGNGDYTGEVKDEVQIPEPYNNSGRDFIDLIQYIKWEDGGYSIRICYYVKDHGSDDSQWKFANRPLSVTSDLLEKLLKLAKKKEWFPKL